MPYTHRTNPYSGAITLAGNFPPTLNKDADPIALEPNESPDSYGLDWDVEGILKSGVIPVGTARLAPVGTGSYTGWNWYYNRLMMVNAVTASQLDIGAPEYRAMYYEQDVGSRTAQADIVTFMPALQDSLWVCTATGSHLMPKMTDTRAFFQLGDFEQSFFTATANQAITLGGVPFVSNDKGVFSWNGSELKEWTRPVRNNIEPFDDVAILADYDERLIIGTDNFVIDTATNRLFDYSTSGFRFTSRTLSQPTSQGRQPFNLVGVAFLMDTTVSTNQKIKWESRTEEGKWYKEKDIIITDKKKKRIEVGLNNPVTNAREFSVRITSVTSGVRIREIQVTVEGYANDALEQ